MAINITAKQLPAVLRRRAREHPEVVKQGLLLAAERGRKLLVRKSPVGISGTFKDAWLVHPRPHGAELENSAPYAGIIELGARPHPVSREGWQAIFEWVRRKIRVTRTRWSRAGRSGGRTGTQITSMRKKGDPELVSITNAIVWKIQTEPTKGHYIVRGSMDDLYRYVNAEVGRALRKHAKAAKTARGGK